MNKKQPEQRTRARVCAQPHLPAPPAVKRSKGPMSAFTSAFESLVGPTRAPNAARVSSRRATRGASTVAAAADSKSAGKGEQAERARMNIAFPTEEQAEMMEKLGFDKPGQEDTVPLVADKFKWDEDRPFHRCASLGAPVQDFPFPPARAHRRPRKQTHTSTRRTRARPAGCLLYTSDAADE